MGNPCCLECWEPLREILAGQIRTQRLLLGRSLGAPKHTATWDGVRNHQAKNNLDAMCRGGCVFFYHSVDERRIVGRAQVIRESYPDPTDGSRTWLTVDLLAVEPAGKPVTLAEIKATSSLCQMALVRNTRLSVQPVTAPKGA